MNNNSKPHPDHRANGEFRKGNGAARLSRDGFDHILRLGVTADQLADYHEAAKLAMAGRGISRRHWLSQWAREALADRARGVLRERLAALPPVKPGEGMARY